MRTFPNHQLVIIAGLIGLLTGCATMSEQKPPVPPMTAQELERIAPKLRPTCHWKKSSSCPKAKHLLNRLSKKSNSAIPAMNLRLRKHWR